MMSAARLRELARGALSAARHARSVSFSQYGEDVLLHNLRPAHRGTYVDVGAFHPWTHSNTYKLYLRGWSGVTIEPNPDVAPLFRQVRPRDIHLVQGIAAAPSRLSYYRFREPLFNSFDRHHAERIQEDVTDVIAIPCLPLRDVIDTHLASGPVDLVSIDSEGLDLTVLQSLDWRRTRPTGIIVEDYAQFESNVRGGGLSEIRSFLAERDYALFSQCMFSFLYVDRRAFLRSGGESGFQLERTQLAATQRASLGEPALHARGGASPISSGSETEDDQGTPERSSPSLALRDIPDGLASDIVRPENCGVGTAPASATPPPVRRCPPA